VSLQSNPAPSGAPRTALPAHHRAGGGFRNPWSGSTPTGLRGLFRWALERARRRAAPLPDPPRVVVPAHANPRAAHAEIRVTAVGHSTFLIQLGPLNIVTDPVWSERCSPLSFAGPRRRHAPGISLDALPPIDVVLLSHDHYDHFDDATIRALAQRHPDATWCAPLGVAAKLRARGARRVVERDWWESTVLGDARVTCLPAAHFSGRTPFDRDATLWCGWAVESQGRRVYFVGDTGMHPEFAEIGRHLGAIDVVFVPVGAYEPRWFMRPVHMNPEEAVDAFGRITAPNPDHPTVMVAMHWGTFILTDEPPDEPPERVGNAWLAERRPADRLWVFAPGETRTLKSAP
jgi:N-acyl-phosphatidylethanolamine-hydrolysing phospholipase D